MNQKNRKRKRKKKTSLSKIFLVVGIVLIIIIAGVFLLVKFNGKAQEEKSAGEQTEDGQTNEDVIAVGADLSLDDSGANPVNQLPPEPEIPEDHRGKAEPIPEEVRAMMAGISMPEGASVSYDDLSYLTVYYHDFEGEDAIGNIVVDADLAEEVLDIFKDLYDIDYPIQSVRLIDEFNDLQTDEFNELDKASMGYNNTSAFCYRAMNSSGTLSKHALGRAIDLNPLINPFVKSGGYFSPPNAGKYVNRKSTELSEIEDRAMIRKGDQVYNIFISRGWRWGCEIWSGTYDYQHFQK